VGLETPMVLCRREGRGTGRPEDRESEKARKDCQAGGRKAEQPGGQPAALAHVGRDCQENANRLDSLGPTAASVGQNCCWNACSPR
jgi:hypothetical protein